MAFRVLSTAQLGSMPQSTTHTKGKVFGSCHNAFPPYRPVGESALCTLIERSEAG